MNISDITFGIGIVESVRSSPDSDSLSGHSLLADHFQITSEGEIVRACLGLSFGVRFRLEESEFNQFAYYKNVVTHPMMTNPNTKKASNGWSDVIVGSNNDWNFNFFTFEHEWEIVCGEWTFEIMTIDDVPLAKVCFQVS
jgi:Domain of unknown function (DUF3859)